MLLQKHFAPPLTIPCSTNPVIVVVAKYTYVHSIYIIFLSTIDSSSFQVLLMLCFAFYLHYCLMQFGLMVIYFFRVEICFLSIDFFYANVDILLSKVT